MKSLIIDKEIIEYLNHCYIIAEIGINHQGSMDVAKEMIRQAKECGAHAVKFQKRDSETLYTRELLDKPYKNPNSFGDTYRTHREALEFSKDQYRELQQYSKEIGITFFATPFDFKSADFLEELNVPLYKIGSGDLKNIPFQKYIAGFKKPVLLSTGGGTLEDVKRSYDAIMPINQQLCLLQCTSAYPAPAELMNLNVIKTYYENFPGVVVGLSDHSLSSIPALVAYGLGARVIEKHFTLDRCMKGSDQKASIEPSELKQLSEELIQAYQMMGSGVKKPHESENLALMKVNKRIVAKKTIPKGKRITENDLTVKSAEKGFYPYEQEKVVGKMTMREILTDESLLSEDLEK